jgi:phage baseplate assembly protein W
MEASNNNAVLSFSPETDIYQNFKVEDEKIRLINSILNIISTPKGTHMDDPEYGTDISNLIFNEYGEDTLNTIKADVTIAINQYEPLYGQFCKVITKVINDKLSNGFNKVILLIVVLEEFGIQIPYLIDRNKTMKSIYNKDF